MVFDDNQFLNYTPMLKTIKESYQELHTAYEIQFDIGGGRAYSFPCDKDGNVESLPPEAVENYKKCMSGEINTTQPPYVKDWSWLVTHPRVCECECGLELEMYADSDGLVYCNCGKCYNWAGQSIRPRSEWEERYDDDY